MARPKNIYAVVDVETASGLDTPLVYDLGLVIGDKNGNVLAKKMWLISEIITDKKKMGTAYYKEKLPLYREMFKADNSILVPYKQAKTEFNAMLKKYKVTTITAYNLAFDLRALKYTNFRLDYENSTGWGMCRFIEDEYQYIDIWSAACETVGKQVSFVKAAKKHRMITDNGNIKTSAETMYKHITRNYDFVEEHTGLADCEIEYEILMKVFKLKKKITQNEIVPHPWRLVQVS